MKIVVCSNSSCSNNLSAKQIKYKGKYCSRSCSASSTNPLHSKESRSTQAEKVRTGKNYIPTKILKSKSCEICEIEFQTYYRTKTCSKTCSLELMSRKRIKFLKENAGTFNWIPNNKPTYFEQSFMDWLDINQYHYIALKYSIHNEDENTTYFLDFFFPSLSLNIELDGTQHEKPESVKRDRIRDAYLKNIGIDVLRISIRDYNKKNNRINCFNKAKEFLRPKKDSNLHQSHLGGDCPSIG